MYFLKSKDQRERTETENREKIVPMGKDTLMVVLQPLECNKRPLCLVIKTVIVCRTLLEPSQGMNELEMTRMKYTGQ